MLYVRDAEIMHGGYKAFQDVKRRHNTKQFIPSFSSQTISGIAIEG